MVAPGPRAAPRPRRRHPGSRPGTIGRTVVAREERPGRGGGITPRGSNAERNAIGRCSSLLVWFLVGLRRLLAQQPWSALPLGATMGWACGWLLNSANLTKSTLLGLGFGLLWLMSGFLPPKCQSGLRRGAHYRVVSSFSSEDYDFREGQEVVFIGERMWIPDERDPIPEQAVHYFIETASGEPKNVSSLVFPTPSQWVSFLQEVPAGTDIRRYD